MDSKRITILQVRAALLCARPVQLVAEIKERVPGANVTSSASGLVVVDAEEASVLEAIQALMGAFGKKFAIPRFEAVAGPRAGAVEFHAGLHSGDMVKTLSANDHALLRQFIPWPFAGDPACYMSGRYVRAEAGWPGHLQENVIRLGDLGQWPKDSGRWIAGRNEEMGKTIASPSFRKFER